MSLETIISYMVTFSLPVSSPIPNVLDSLISFSPTAQRYMAGSGMLRQLYFAALDLEFHIRWVIIHIISSFKADFY